MIYFLYPSKSEDLILAIEKRLEAVHKRRPHKIAKNLRPIPLVRKMSTYAQPPCPQNVRTGHPPDLDIFYGQPLTILNSFNLINKQTNKITVHN